MNSNLLVLHGLNFSAKIRLSLHFRPWFCCCRKAHALQVPFSLFSLQASVVTLSIDPLIHIVPNFGVLMGVSLHMGLLLRTQW